MVALLLHGLVLSGLPRVVGRSADRAPPAAQWRAVVAAAPPAVAADGSVAPAIPPAPAPRAPSEAPPTSEAAPSPARVAESPPADPAPSLPEPAPRIAEAASSPDLPLAPPAEPVPPPPPPALPMPSPPVVTAATEAPAALAPEGPAPARAEPATGAASSPLWIAETGDPMPVYPTRFAPSQVLSYQLRRGLLSGSAQLEWERDEPGDPGARYRLQLLARAAGLAVMTQESQGGFDPAGLAPRRFTDQRLRGAARAANFQRERGRISFSGPSVEYAWVAGVQDRLSWMLQLPAIVEASPQLARPGERITLGVIGARGDAAVWVFRFEAAERVSLGGGEVDTLKFIREPRRPNDTQAEVWLDPARHHLPARARLSQPPDGEVLDLVRETR